jgi:kynureninase
MNFEDGREFAATLDADDPLRGFRERFEFPLAKGGHEPVYLCGNSLGLQPKLAARYVEEELAQWRDYAVDGHFHPRRPWLSCPRRATAALAGLAGAQPSEVVAMNTLTVNLHVLMASFYRPSGARFRILIESQAFPSDRYAAASQIRMRGYDPADGIVEWTPRRDGSTLDTDDLAELLEREGKGIALLLLPGVQYLSGQVLDMREICRLGRQAGCAVGFDLAHAIGNVELALHDWGPDFAAWCCYKYLNGGPGAIGGAFVHERHFDDGTQALLGWWGNDEATRFEMAPAFTPAAGAERWQMSTPPILSLAPVVAALELFREAGMAALAAKSRQLTGYLAWLIAERFAGVIDTITPTQACGCQLSLVVRDDAVDGRALFEALCERNVTGDWRQPNVIRVAPVPLYNSFADVFEFAERLADALTAPRRQS